MSKPVKTAKPRPGANIAQPPPSGAGMPAPSALSRQYLEDYNPLRGLTPRRVASLLELYDRGDMTQLMWLYRKIERRYPTLAALVTRRTAAIKKIEWRVSIVSGEDQPKNFSQALADDQAAVLRDYYGAIKNIKEAISHLALATFRGFAHLQRFGPQGEPERWEILDQWNVVRRGLQGPWKWNPDANPVSYEYLPENMVLDPANFIIRQSERPIDEIALILFVRDNLAEKDWDAHLESFGRPGCVIVGPPNVPTDREQEFADNARRVASGAGGYLPNGSEATFPSASIRSAAPFKERADHLSEQVVLVGTGGKLTMITEAGSGTLAGGAQADVFDDIGAAEAVEISECIQEQSDALILAEMFPGQPILAYFELAHEQESSTEQLVADIALLSTAGYQTDAEWIKEETGYPVEVKPDPAAVDPAANPEEDPALQNRTPLPPAIVNAAPAAAPVKAVPPLRAAAQQEIGSALGDALAPLRAAIADALAAPTDAEQVQRLMVVRASIPGYLAQIGPDSPLAAAFERLYGAAMVNGLTARNQDGPETS